MNKRGFELAVSTIIIIIISIAVLIGLILLLTKGFGFWKSGTDPIIDSQAASAAKQACEISCRAENYLSFCCSKFDIDGRNVTCSDKALAVSCALDCSATTCLAD